MAVIRSVFCAALVLVLAACATEEAPVQMLFNKPCVTEISKKQATVNWNQAKVVNMTIRDGVYSPDENYMKVGEPTILRIANNDNPPRYFVDGEFLDSVALVYMSVGAAKYERPCVSGVIIGAGTTAELRLVPLTAGVYYPESSPLEFLGIQQGKTGFIYVDG